jgi:hypothetical protein
LVSSTTVILPSARRLFPSILRHTDSPCFLQDTPRYYGSRAQGGDTSPALARITPSARRVPRYITQEYLRSNHVLLSTFSWHGRARRHCLYLFDEIHPGVPIQKQWGAVQWGRDEDIGKKRVPSRLHCAQIKRKSPRTPRTSQKYACETEYISTV